MIRTHVVSFTLPWAALLSPFVMAGCPAEAIPVLDRRVTELTAQVEALECDCSTASPLGIQEVLNSKAFADKVNEVVDLSSSNQRLDALDGSVVELSLPFDASLVVSGFLTLPLQPDSGCTNGFAATRTGWHLIQATASFGGPGFREGSDEVRLLLDLGGTTVELSRLVSEAPVPTTLLDANADDQPDSVDGAIHAVTLSGSHIAPLNAGTCVTQLVLQQGPGAGWEVDGGDKTRMTVAWLRP